MLSSSFYLFLILISLILFADTTLNSYTFIVMPLLIVEWWRSICYCQMIKGELAIFHHIRQIYWYNQRWYLVRKPLIFRYVVILNLRSRRNSQRRTLFLMFDSISPDDWRTLRYYLYQIEFNSMV
ncbi:hypothetical protein A9G34_02010 [Gilliamella sp. Choc4-2]|nr:hypothetical protein A9G33_04445 [Gilliamella apicola]OCG45133.1 hypothetical protein A9G34_02010 [Gilliamella apicola]OCG54705.1 hypothetical protein A9G36_07680 [Gilliamella apicola]OCG62967.1 hypothetical protein A9G48_06810 [Gilliamella apicola]